MPPPSSGAIAIGQILGILTNTSANKLARTPDGLPDHDWLSLYAEASRLAFADRALYLSDPDFALPPAGSWTSLLGPDYLARRAQLIDQSPGGKSMKVAKPGNPGDVKSALAPMAEQIEHGTSHISIVDPFGNSLAMTTTIEDQFGARLMVNRGKGLAGSPGGALIIHITAKTLYGVLNWGMTPQQAIDLPNFASLNGPTLLEEKRFPASTVERLHERDAEVREMPLTSGLQAIVRGPAHGMPLWLGGADPRREGIVMGD